MPEASKGFLNSSTIRNGLYMALTYVAGLYESNTGTIATFLESLLPAYLDPGVPYFVQGVGAILALLFTTNVVKGRLKAGKEPSEIQGLFK